MTQRQALEGAKVIDMATGAFALEDGRFVDLAVVESARRTLALARYAQKGTA